MLVPGDKIIDFGVVLKALANVITTAHALDCVPVPDVMVKDPAESDEPEAIVAVGVVPHADGVPIVGGFVCVLSKWALLRFRVANAVVVPATVIIRLFVSAVNRVSASLALWIWKAVVEFELDSTRALPVMSKAYCGLVLSMPT